VGGGCDESGALGDHRRGKWVEIATHADPLYVDMSASWAEFAGLFRRTTVSMS
jgi:hypothetical protein